MNAEYYQERNHSLRAAELWAALNIAGLDGDLPDEATVARVARAYLAATADARREGYQAASRQR